MRQPQRNKAASRSACRRSPKPGGKISRGILPWPACSGMKNTNQTSQIMKKILCLATGLLALNFTPAFGQPSQENSRVRIAIAQAEANAKQSLTKFNLNFPGGTPAELVKAIEKAMGKPLNAIIPTDDADIQLPPLKMNDVVTLQLFAALQAASRKTVAVQSRLPVNYNGGYSTFTTDYGFTTSDNPVSDTSIWYFHASKPSMPPLVSTEKVCRFYQLASYLDRGFTVDDITTAIQTGWKMAGINPPPELNYHKETKLLIAYGTPDDLNIIQSVLQSLPSSNATRNEIDTLRSQIKDLQDQVSLLKKGIIEGRGPRRGPPEENSGK
jgi:hypothetical protein